MSNSALHSVSVAGVTFDDEGRVLLIRRRDNSEWQAPGGVLEPGEAFEAGVEREVFEETGVYVTVGPLTGVYKNMSRGVVALVYRCTPLHGSPKPTTECVEVEWVGLTEALSRMKPAFAVRVEDARVESTYHAASRRHDGERLI